MTSLRVLSSLLVLSSLAGCSCETPSDADAGRDAPLADVPLVDSPAPVDAPDDTATVDAGIDAPTDGGVSCLELGHTAGERYSAGDACNFCDCNADGTSTCTDRTCFDSIGGCEYEGTEHDYGARFPSADGCNECVCAASGLACTVRPACTDVPESAILLESANQPCGENPDFTPAMVLAGLPTTDFTAPFLYERVRELYPEVLPDTTIRVRIVFDEGFMVCRIPDPSQPALDLQVTVEWITEDGAFHEGFPAYLRKNDFGFLDTWMLAASAPLGGLAGSYRPICAIDPGGYGFEAQVAPDGSATGSVSRVCETDLSFTVGSFERPAP